MITNLKKFIPSFRVSKAKRGNLIEKSRLPRRSRTSRELPRNDVVYSCLNERPAE